MKLDQQQLIDLCRGKQMCPMTRLALYHGYQGNGTVTNYLVTLGYSREDIVAFIDGYDGSPNSGEAFAIGRKVRETLSISVEELATRLNCSTTWIKLHAGILSSPKPKYIRWTYFSWTFGLFRNRREVVPGRWGFTILGLEFGCRNPGDPVGVWLKEHYLWPF